MLFALAWLFNFLIGGLSGVFLSDVPSDVTTHGSFFSMAHFHYTIMGGLIFSFFAAIYYWVPKMTGYAINERWGKVHFWVMFLSFNSTFGPLLVIGFLGCRAASVTYAGYLQGANDWVSVSAFVLGASMLIFIANFVWSQVFARVPAGSNPWGSKSIEWQLPSPVPVHNFDRIPTFGGDPYPYGDGRRLDAGAASSRSRRRGRRRDRARASGDGLLGGRARAARGDGAQPSRRSAPLVERDRVLLRRVPLRVLLPPLAELHGTVAPAARRRPIGDARHGDHSRVRRLRVSAVATSFRGTHPSRRRSPTAGASGSSRSRSAFRPADCRSSSSRRSGFGPTEGGFASVFLGWTGPRALCSRARCTGSRRSSPRRFAIGARRSSGTNRAKHRAIRTEAVTTSRSRCRWSAWLGAKAFAFYWTVLAGIGVATWLILYLL